MESNAHWYGWLAVLFERFVVINFFWDSSPWCKQVRYVKALCETTSTVTSVAPIRCHITPWLMVLFFCVFLLSTSRLCQQSEVHDGYKIYVHWRPSAHLPLRSEVTSHPGWFYFLLVIFFCDFLLSTSRLCQQSEAHDGDHRHICRSDQMSHHTLACPVLADPIIRHFTHVTWLILSYVISRITTVLT